jgi:hypothetical protein
MATKFLPLFFMTERDRGMQKEKNPKAIGAKNRKNRQPARVRHPKIAARAIGTRGTPPARSCGTGKETPDQDKGLSPNTETGPENASAPP